MVSSQTDTPRNSTLFVTSTQNLVSDVQLQQNNHRRGFSTKAYVIVTVVLVLTGAAITLGILIGIKRFKVGTQQEDDAVEVIPPSQMGYFPIAAVVTDSVPCAKAGKEMLVKNGSAVDAAIATLLCMGVYNGQSSGIGGGFFMTIYLRDSKTARVIDARETAPGAASVDMYKENPDSAFKGGSSIAVPGEIRGMEEAHKQYGRLPWADLFQPAIRLATNGFPAGMHLARALRYQRDMVRSSKTLSEVFVNPETKDVFVQGDTVHRPMLAKTLQLIASKGANEFYSGSIAKLLVQDIQKFGGNITMQDMQNYKARVKPSTITRLKGLTMYSVPPPGSGEVLGFILRLLDLYNMTAADLGSVHNQTVTYQRYIEALKFGYAYRTKLGDEDFAANVSEVVREMQSNKVISETFLKIMDNATFPPAHYGALVSIQDYGTAHMAVIAPNGDAVSATNTINYWFGSGVRSPTTGIILNNEMDDFSSPHKFNKFGLPPSVPNYIEPGKRPISSMCPAIFTNDNGDVTLAIGAAGGSRITSAVALVATKVLHLGENIKEAIDDGRIHHQLVPNTLEYEPKFPQAVLDNLQQIGHKTKKAGAFGSVVVGIHRNANRSMYTNYDFRKGGSQDGF